MEFKHQMIGSTLLFKYHDPVFNDVGIINYKRNLAILLEKHQVKDIILDVEKTKIVDNNGLSAIMFARRFTQANGHTCILAMPRPKLLSLLKTSKLNEAFKIIQRKEEYQSFLKALVEKAEKERLEREAEKAKKAEEARKAKEEAQKQDVKAQETKSKDEEPEKEKPGNPGNGNGNGTGNGNGSGKRKPRKKIVKKD